VKLAFEIIGTLFATIVLATHLPVTEGGIYAISYCAGFAAAALASWLTIEFLRRVWRMLRRYDAIAQADTR
jgi:hypothetical protein